MSDVIKDRRDIDGNPVTLDKLCRLEPAWAASRIRVMEAELARLRAVRQPPGCDCPFEAGQHKLSCSSSGRMVVVSGAICWFLRWVLDEDERRALRRGFARVKRMAARPLILPPEPCGCHGDPWCEDDK